MADLIDREVLIAEYEYLKAECYEALGDAWDDVIARAKRQPRVDAEPVRHAHWIEHCEAVCWLVECSHCHKEAHICNLDDGCIYYDNAPYCPFCGARMDEEVDNG